MKKRFLAGLLCLMLVVYPVAHAGTASEEWTEEDRTAYEQSRQEDIEPEPTEGSERGMESISNPTQAFLKVNTRSYGCPNPNTGYQLEIVSANTNVWVVEKSYCSAVGKYYYYAGYSYGGENHRGYFSEDNVYLTATARLLPENVTAETNPAGMKTFTSLSGTVYDGPATSYSVTGSVGQESIKLIRTEGNYNFIEYTVDSNGKFKRGFLHYSKIYNIWGNLTAQTVSYLDGRTFFAENMQSGKYLSSLNNNSGDRMRLYTFTGSTNTILKFKYSVSGKYYYIQPASCYSENIRAGVTTSGEHDTRQLKTLTNDSSATNQRFWVVKTGVIDYTFKILPVSSYGTMTLTKSGTYVNQYYTNDGPISNSPDAWRFHPTNATIETTYYGKPADGSRSNCCWAFSAKTMVSAFQYIPDRSIDSGIIAVKGSLIDEGGTVFETSQIANCFFSGDKNDSFYYPLAGKIFSAQNMTKIINSGNPIEIMVIPLSGNEGHWVTIVKYKWIDDENGPGSPGGYRFYYYCSDSGNTLIETTFGLLTTYTAGVMGYTPARWINSVVYGSDNAALAQNWQ